MIKKSYLLSVGIAGWLIYDNYPKKRSICFSTFGSGLKKAAHTRSINEAFAKLRLATSAHFYDKRFDESYGNKQLFFSNLSFEITENSKPHDFQDTIEFNKYMDDKLGIFGLQQLQKIISISCGEFPFVSKTDPKVSTVFWGIPAIFTPTWYLEWKFRNHLSALYGYLIVSNSPVELVPEEINKEILRQSIPKIILQKELS